MKKLVATISAVVTTVLMCVLLAACSGSIVGTYKFSSMSMTAPGMEINVKAGEEYMGTTLKEDYIVLEVKEDNTFTMTTAGAEAVNGEWREEDGKYILTVAGEDQTVTLKGNELTMEMSQSGMSSKVVLKK